MQLVIVSGPEATGKTHIGRSVAGQLGCQYVSKDMIKESLFDTGTRSTWDSGWYEHEAKEIFFDTIKDFIDRDESIVIESNFIGADRDRLIKLLNPKVEVSEIYCTARGLTSFRRFVRRNESNHRHKGHHDRRWYVKVFMQDMLRYVHVSYPYKPVRITQKLLTVDSTNIASIDKTAISKFIETSYRSGE